jgi:hypothetical protein
VEHIRTTKLSIYYSITRKNKKQTLLRSRHRERCQRSETVSLHAAAAVPENPLVSSTPSSFSLQGHLPPQGNSEIVMLNVTMIETLASLSGVSHPARA